MRGSAKKKIEQFVDILIQNTPPEELNKTREAMIAEVKSFWKSKDKEKQKFIHKVYSGDFDSL